MSYFYAVSRRDIPHHQQAIQSAHAQLDFLHNHDLKYDEHPSFVWLTVANRWDLLVLEYLLEDRGIKSSLFKDPDFDGYDPSAIAFMLPEEQRYLVAELPLWNCYTLRGAIRKWMTRGRRWLFG